MLFDKNLAVILTSLLVTSCGIFGGSSEKDGSSRTAPKGADSNQGPATTTSTGGGGTGSTEGGAGTSGTGTKTIVSGAGTGTFSGTIKGIGFTLGSGFAMNWKSDTFDIVCIQIYPSKMDEWISLYDTGMYDFKYPQTENQSDKRFLKFCVERSTLKFKASDYHGILGSSEPLSIATASSVSSIEETATRVKGVLTIKGAEADVVGTFDLVKCIYNTD